MLKRMTNLLLICVMAVALTACGGETVINTTNVEIEVEDYGVIKVELYPDMAPETVKNFLKLIDEGFYDGLVFHRVVSSGIFVIQGGGEDVDGMPHVAETIVGEFASNGYEKNTLSHERGVISMARADDPNSGSSQFFICSGDSTGLDGQYAGFGKVTDGMDIVDKIVKLTTFPNSDRPLYTPVIKTIRRAQ